VRGRCHRVALFVVLFAAWLTIEISSGGNAGLLYLAPVVVLCASLLLGRYVGEEQLERLTRRSRPPRTRRSAITPAPRSHVRVMQRGGRLVASALAKRPPPRRALALIT
jgi:hypothetical protein